MSISGILTLASVTHHPSRLSRELLRCLGDRAFSFAYAGSHF
jgi:hypothetical protein